MFITNGKLIDIPKPLLPIIEKKDEINKYNVTKKSIIQRSNMVTIYIKCDTYFEKFIFSTY